MSWVQVPPEQLFLPFHRRVVQVSCIALFIYVGIRVFMQKLYRVGCICVLCVDVIHGAVVHVLVHYIYTSQPF